MANEKKLELVTVVGSISVMGSDELLFFFILYQTVSNGKALKSITDDHDWSQSERSGSSSSYQIVPYMVRGVKSIQIWYSSRSIVTRV